MSADWTDVRFNGFSYFLGVGLSEVQPTRRDVTRGVSWSIPVLATAASAPAVAASGTPPQLFTYGRVNYNEYFTGGGSDGSNAIKIFSTANGSAMPGPGVCVENTTTATEIANVSQTFWLASNALRFTRDTYYGSSCWTTPTFDGTKNPVDAPNRYTYYPYTMEYTCSITPVNGTTCLQAFAFQAQSYYSPNDIHGNAGGYFYAATNMTIDGGGMRAPESPGPYPMS